MKNSSLFILWVVFLLFSQKVISQQAVTKSINIGVIEYPPHITFQGSKIEGKLIKYISSVFTKEGYDIEITQLPRGRAIVELQKGNIELLLPYDELHEEIKVLTSPLFHAMPGLCFRKENFIPILSATHQFKHLTVGAPVGTPVVSALKNSQAVLVPLIGDNSIKRGIDLTQRGRIDAFYHPSPVQVYHQENTEFKELACSYFHGYSNGVYVAVKPNMSQENFDKLNRLLNSAIHEMSYGYYFAK
ncbi:transporter substrate-binding domain-containing protein [Litorilituus lipolyticus]|uniref:transporter substrate-binding domain-containing protein n=1 Tax=Litorilituus lipolyticus TaxID=2491017 RepID=UPI001478D757|nr:transporter substrate-binding domain-containing protein [Litorilituus lipolyticus]